MGNGRVYVSGALTGVANADELRRLYENIAAAATTAGYEPYLPHTGGTDPIDHPHVTPADVYAIDMRQVHAADIIIAWLSEPSLGVGAELALAVTAGKRVIGLRRKDSVVSRFIVGMLEAAGQPIVTVDGPDDLDAVVTTLRRLTVGQ